MTVGSLAAAVATPAGAAPARPAPIAGHTSAATKSPHPVKALCGTATTPGTSECFALARTDVVPHTGANPADTPAGYGPADLQSAYSLPATGSGRTVAIVDAFDDPDAESDLAVYRAQYGLPACTTANGCFRKVNQHGEAANYPPADSGWAGEITLDVDVVSAACPACSILLVEADDNDNDNLAAAVTEAVTLGAKFVSNSYGAPEDPSQTQYDSVYSEPGIAITASTGDDGFGTSYPASSPGVTAVGGTSLTTASNSRGWSESAWAGAGSGCSTVEAKPSFQTDTGCDHRTVADVSAVADPDTGVAVYNTYGDSGWRVYGGTSASSPLIAATYALAGQPGAGSSPNSYPYRAASGLNDVTTGNNGTCTPSYLCTSGAGYDGPTGLGTPHGVAAFTETPHGTVTGVVNSASNGKPVAGVKITAGASSTITGSNGRYSLDLPPGSYHVVATAYGYRTPPAAKVRVAVGVTTKADFSLTASPRTTVSGVVTDGSGHGYPLYARITLDGVPGAPFYTDPFTGYYSVDLPTSTSYVMHVEPVEPGYTTPTSTLKAGTGPSVQNVSVKVDVTQCAVAPGYAAEYTGATQHFDAPTAPAGWKVTGDASQGVWGFTDPGDRGNLTGGSGGFAMIDSDHLGVGRTQDTYLTSPVYDLSAASTPVLDLNTYFQPFLTSAGDIQVSSNGGTTWTTVQHYTGTLTAGAVEVALPSAAGKPKVQVRFHYTGSFAYFWEVDDVFVGQKTCAPTPGGLVAGFVTDHNTGAGLDGATVTSTARPADKGTSAPTPADAHIGDGFYWLFSSLTGAHPFTASLGRYTPARKTVTVASNYVTRADFSLQAGRITTSSTSVTITEKLGSAGTAVVGYTNAGTKPVTVTLSEAGGGFTIRGVPAPAVYATQPGAAVQHRAGTYSPRREAKPGAKAAAVTPTRSAHPSDAPWTAIADYPTPISNNVAAFLDGKVYDFGGYDGSEDVAAGYVYDPSTQDWTATAPMSVTREAASATVVDGKIIVSGGWGPDGSPTGVTEAYDPATDSWTELATNPTPHAAAAYSVIDGKVYLVGGCSSDSCGSTDVEVYDPATNTWSAGVDYPVAVSWAGCGAVSDTLYCSGGTTDDATLTSTYAFDPTAGTWTAKADLPADDWAAAYAAVGGKLLVSGGVISDSSEVTNEGWSYDPASDAWTALPNSNNAFYRLGSACGFYKIGGSVSNDDPAHAESEVLPGYDDCGGADVAWLSESTTAFTVAPGATVKVTITADSSVVTQPGTYVAQLTAATDSPYPLPPVQVTMVVTPPSTWGKITGTVTGTACGATPAPIAGATLQIDTWATSYTLTTAADGTYALWLDRRNDPLTLIAAKDGWAPQTAQVSIRAGATLTKDFALKPGKACS